ncbi:MAG: ABC-2 transporter permease [Herbinix sp.]|nr:ABC-2 transporter permease [Herbinix sp.]
MKGLILKDFINLKKNLKIFGVLTLLYGFMSYTSGDASFFSTIFTMLFAILTLSLYSYDEMAKWDGYAITMPISKENIVQGKYLMMILLTFIGAVFGFLFAALMYITAGMNSLLQSIESCGIGAAVVILFYSIALPFITKLGVEKARLIFFAVYMIPFAIIFLINKEIKAGKLVISDNFVELVNYLERYLGIIIPVVVLLALGISYTISLNIYRHKEF